MSLLLVLACDTSNFQLGKPLTVTLLFTVVFTTTHFDDADFVVTTMDQPLLQLLLRQRQLEHRFECCHRLQPLIRHQKYVCASFSFQQFYFKGFTLNNTVLFTTALDYCVHNVLQHARVVVPIKGYIDLKRTPLGLYPRTMVEEVPLVGWLILIGFCSPFRKPIATITNLCF